MAKEKKIRLSGEDARGGETPGIVRYVLFISLGLVVVAFAAVLLFR